MKTTQSLRIKNILYSNIFETRPCLYKLFKPVLGSMQYMKFISIIFTS